MGITEAQIKRINELYHKSKDLFLTEDEKKEQKLLRQKYIESVRLNLRNQLENIHIQEKDGTITNVSDKIKKKVNSKK